MNLPAASPLSDLERRRLRRLERRVEEGVRAFLDVGRALTEIRDQRLYRETHGTFEIYCEKRWKFTHRRANQLIRASKVGTMVPVENERQARELAALVHDEQAVVDAWNDAQAQATELGTKVTTKNIQNAVAKRTRSRAPLPDAAGRAGWELRKSVERVQRILEDDRYPANREAVDAQLRPQLGYTIDTCTPLAQPAAAGDQEHVHIMLQDVSRLADALRQLDHHFRSLKDVEPGELRETITKVTEVQQTAAQLSGWLADVGQAYLTLRERKS
jgi:hypothetical protein